MRELDSVQGVCEGEDVARGPSSVVQEPRQSPHRLGPVSLFEPLRQNTQQKEIKDEWVILANGAQDREEKAGMGMGCKAAQSNESMPRLLDPLAR